MKKKLLSVLQYLFFAALAAFFVWLSLKDMDTQKWAQLKDALHRANYWLLVPVLAVASGQSLAAGASLAAADRADGLPAIRMNCFLAVMIGYFVNLARRVWARW